MPIVMKCRQPFISLRPLRCNGCPQVSTWQVPKSYAWRQVFVNEANEVTDTSEPVEWEGEDLTGQHPSLFRVLG